MRAQTSSKTVLAWFMLVDGVLGCFSRCGIYHSFVVQGLRALPGDRNGEPPWRPSSFHPPIFPPIFTPDFAGDFPSHFYPRFCRGFSEGVFHPAFSTSLSGGRFSPPIFPVQNFHPLYRHGPDSHPPLNESAKNRTFTISAKSVMLRTQNTAPQKSSPHPPKPHPQKPLSPKGDIGGFGDD